MGFGFSYYHSVILLLVNAPAHKQFDGWKPSPIRLAGGPSNQSQPEESGWLFCAIKDTETVSVR